MRACPRRGRVRVAPLFLRCVTWLAAVAGGAPAQAWQGGSASDAGLSPPSPSATRVVDVTILGDGDDAGPLMETIRQLVGRLGLDVRGHRLSVPESSPDAGWEHEGLSVWIDLASRYEVVTIVRDGNAEVRRTIARDASPAIVREEIGEAVRSAVESRLLVDEPPRAPAPAGVVDAPPAATTVAEAANLPATPSPLLAIDVTTLGGAGLVAAEAGIVAHVGGGVALASRGRWRPSLSMTGEYVLPFVASIKPGRVASQAYIVSLRTVAAVELLHRAWVAVDVGAGGGVDVFGVSATQGVQGVDPSVHFQDVPTAVDPVVTARATTYLGMTPGVMFTIVVGGDIGIAPPRYKAVTGGDDVFLPWRVRPVILAGFTFTASGSGRFATRAP